MAVTKFQRVVHVGAVPPPFGGVTVHCARIMEVMQERGIEVELVQPRFDEKKSMRESLLGIVSLAKQLLFSPRVVFMHFSTPSCHSKAFSLVLMALLCRRSELILVPHSGKFADDLRRGRYRHAIRICLRHSYGLIGLNNSIVEAALEVAPELVVRRGASFIPTSELRSCRTEACIASGEISIANDVRVIVASGYRTEIYGYEAIVSAFVDMQHRSADRLQLKIFTYGDEDPTYWRRIEKLVEDIEDVQILRDESLQSFLTELSAASLYIRNTSHDSYGVAIAEALFLGTPVVASDSCQRHEAVELFDWDVPGSISSVALAALNKPRSHSSLEDGSEAYIKFLLDLRTK